MQKEHYHKDISIFAELGTALYSIVPIVNQLVARKITVFIYTNGDKKKAAEFLNLPIENVININSLSSRYLSLLDYLIKSYFKREEFNSFHTNKPVKIPLFSILTQFLILLPKPSLKNINSIYNTIWSLIIRRKVFKTKNVLVISRSDNNYLLNSRYHNYYALVDSWDHAMKSSFFFKPIKTFVWNNDIKKDIEYFQNFKSKNIHLIFPLKFRYLKEIKTEEFLVKNREIKNEILFLNTNKYILFICTYSLFSGKDLYNEQIILIRDIHKTIKKTGLTLYIKPHPHSRSDEYDHLVNELGDNIRVGVPAILNGFGYIFSNDDQYYKIELMKKALLIINLGTTLVIEASQLNNNICQLKVNKKSYPNIFDACNNSHVLRYLNENKDIVNLEENKIQIITQLLERPNKFSSQIRNWAFTSDYQNSILHIVKNITN